MKLAIKILLILLIAFLLHYFFASFETFETLKNFLKENNREDIFLCVMALVTPFGFPLSFCYIFAGLAFPIYTAYPVVLLGLMVSSSIGYIVGKFFLAKNVKEQMLKKFKIESASAKNLYRINFFVRAVPGIPYFVQNLILAAIGTKYFQYILINLGVQGIISLAMISFAASLQEKSSTNFFILIFVCLALYALYQILFRTFFKEKSDNS